MVVGEYRLYYYNPSFGAAVAAISCFGVVTSIHIIYLVIRKTWFMIPFAIGGIFETIGYVGRMINSRQTPAWETGPYIMQTLLLLIAPAFLAASVYMLLGRIIHITRGDSRSAVSRRWITGIFVTGDVISLFVQAGGGGVLAQSKTNHSQKLGNWIIITGLGIQIFFLELFITVAAIFHLRMRFRPTEYSLRTHLPWERYLIVLYIVSCLITGRSAFRVVEYVQGSKGASQSKEFWLYIFDGLLMLFVMIILVVMHPSRIILGEDSTEHQKSRRVRGERRKKRTTDHQSRRTGYNADTVS